MSTGSLDRRTNFYDAVKVIGHDDKQCIVDFRIMIRDVFPVSLDYLAQIIEPHAAVFDSAEKTHLAVSADGHEISTVAVVMNG